MRSMLSQSLTSFQFSIYYISWFRRLRCKDGCGRDIQWSASCRSSLKQSRGLGWTLHMPPYFLVNVHCIRTPSMHGGLTHGSTFTREYPVGHFPVDGRLWRHRNRLADLLAGELLEETVFGSPFDLSSLVTRASLRARCSRPSTP
jgi:hypothetical protein